MQSNKTNALKGEHKPRIEIDPLQWEYTDGADAAELMAVYGLELDLWQQLVLNAWLARTEDDHLVYMTCGLSVPRQNGKNVIIEARELYGAVVNGEKILHTAHQVKTSKKAFNRLASIFENPDHPELNELVKSIRRTNGEEAIYLTNGGSVEYSARSRGAARGWTVDTVILDEAQELTDEQMEALMPTLSAAATGDRQLIYTGTPPPPTSPGEVFRRIRKQCIETQKGRACWHEWSVEEVGDINDRTRWYETNPALGVRLDEDFCQEECSSMSPDGFARERLGWWTAESATLAIKTSEWQACAIDEPPTEGNKSFGIKFDLEGEHAAIVAARKPDESVPYVELVALCDTSNGVGEIADFINKAADTTALVAIDGRANADALYEQIRGSFPRQGIALATSKTVIASSSMFLDAIKGKELTHWSSEGQSALDESVTTSIKRPIGHDGGFGFGGDNCLAVEAAALAFWAISTTRRNPSRGCVLI